MVASGWFKFVHIDNINKRQYWTYPPDEEEAGEWDYWTGFGTSIQLWTQPPSKTHWKSANIRQELVKQNKSKCALICPIATLKF